MLSPTAFAFALRLRGFPISFQDRLGVSGMLIAGHQVHLPTFRPLMKILDRIPIPVVPLHEHANRYADSNA